MHLPSWKRLVPVWQTERVRDMPERMMNAGFLTIVHLENRWKRFHER